MDYKIKLKKIKESCEILRINDDAQGFVTSLISQNFSENDIIFIAQNDAHMALLKQQILFFSPQLEEKYEILNFDAWDCMPYDKSSPKQIISSNRIKTLYKLSNRQNKNFIVITSINAVLQKIISPNLVKNSSLILKVGDKISIKQIVDFLVFNGYQRQSCAYTSSEFALRGGIIDIVVNKASSLIGYRLDFFGEEVESIKEFDPLTQLSSDKVRQIELLPATEVILNDETVNNFRENYRKNFQETFSLNNQDHLYEAVSAKRYFQGLEHYLPFFYKENLIDIFSYLKNPVIFLNEQIFSLAKNHHEKVEDYYQARVDDSKQNKGLSTIYNPIKPDLLYFNNEEFRKTLEKNINIVFRNFDSANKNSRLIDLEIKPIPDFNLAAKANKQDPVELVCNFIKTQNKKVFIAAINENSKERIEKLLQDFEVNKPVCIVSLDKGFETSDTVIIGEQAIFGEKIVGKKSTRNKDAAKRILEEGLTINIGELVVHSDYGIGKFDGVHKIEASDIKTDMIKIIYGGGDVLFIAVEDINLITRYGDANSLVDLDRLGVSAWKNRKSKVRNRIKVAAEELIKIAAQRHFKTAPIFVANEHFYDEFRARFGFVETDDQINAIEEVEEDLRKGSPMDRLICGDVGFGKTEVAMRAAFIVASNNYDYEAITKIFAQNDNDDKNFELSQNHIIAKKTKSQIAIITPTTLLCRQHYKNFVKRFEGTDIKISQLSRLTSATQNKKTKAQIENGEIDIVIGTHALLAKSMKFQNLALLIIDEEQHFGVAQKERLKEFRNEVHILTLSATPIPRTLQMSLTGVKDLSLIATPPIDRLAVRNFVMPFDATIIKEAIIREYQRSGKVFFVVPRIKYIAEIENKLKKILPEEIRFTHAHGQMTPNELDKIMNDFYDDKIDVLLSTTIIESGIDIATANTMIIYKAEMFGLAQLYQLRGRVGRGKTRGYAYFMTSDKSMNNVAKKKLEVMQHLDELGVGFTIASHDMDIRGSGDILGAEQSGHVKETGVELYQQMLLEEIEKLKNRENSALSQAKNEVDFTLNPQIKLGISLAISEEYISDLPLRMSFYKKIALVRDQEEQENLENEMLDRFGKIPQETKNLLKISVLKHQCKKLGIERIEGAKDGGILVKFHNNSFKNPQKLLEMVFSSKNQIKLQPDQKLLFLGGGEKNHDKIEKAFKAFEKLLSLY